jgi:uncharacterized protein YfaS (alpha-2-macroglobulin family)
LLLFVVVCLLAVRINAARVSPDIDETDIKLLFDDKQTAAVLSIENNTGRALDASVQVELLTPKDDVFTRSVLSETLRAGANTLHVPLAIRFGVMPNSEQREFLFYRLRYRIAPQAATTPGAPAASEAVEGIVSLSEITPDIFELNVVAPRKLREGAHYRVRVRAVHPLTARGTKDVRVEGEIDFDDDEQKDLKATASTDAEGNAALDFLLPHNVSENDLDLKVTARRGIFQQEVEEDVEFDEAKGLLLTTDKSLYQPGQTLHMRVLIFDALRRAVADDEATLEITDPEGKTAFRAPLQTSRFGVASADWQIPDNTRLGEYRLNVSTSEGEFSEGSISSQVVKISRYDLPNFSVSAKPDRPYYLAGQQADIEVRADYLFGQPVAQGQVRVVRQTEREWNYKEQKYETKEGASVEGKLDASGRFVARLDLHAAHKELSGLEYSRVQDINFAAYVTDATTNRTEQRRFTLRLTKEPIHIYIIEGRYDQAAGLPLAFYLTTFYADGTPASCDVEIRRESAAGEANQTANGAGRVAASSAAAASPPSLRVRTNRYGVAKVSGPPVGARGDESDDRVALRLVARDREGRSGKHSESFWLHNDRQREIRVESDKTVYRAGEPVELEIRASGQQSPVYLDVAQDSRVVLSKTVRLREGRAKLTLPYTDDFKDRLTITAWSYETDEDAQDYYRQGYASGTRTVVYPRNHDLKLDVRFDKTEYRPGEDASAELRVRAADGRRVEGALGVVVFDKAVEERARTDQDFGADFGFGSSFKYFRYGGDNISGITPRDIERLDMSKPLSGDIQSVAEVLLNYSSGGYEPHILHDTSFIKTPGTLFDDLTRKHVKPLESALQTRYAEQADYPHDDAQLRRMLLDADINMDALRDPWGTPYRAAFSVERDKEMLDIISAGADKRAGTPDDFSTLRMGWPYFRSIGERIDRAVAEYHKRTGAHVRDAATLKGELARAGFDMDALRDPWGQPYALTFGISATNYTINVVSHGPDRQSVPSAPSALDDFNVWTSLSDDFAGMREGIARALVAHQQQGGRFPQTEDELRRALAAHHINRDALRDAWGRVLKASFGKQAGYAQQFESRGQYDPGASKQRTETKPVGQVVYDIRLYSLGPDGIVNQNDFVAGYFSSIPGGVLNATPDDQKPLAPRSLTILSGGRGAIQGTITDPNGASVAGASVVARHHYAELEFSAVTNEEGVFFMRNLPSGYYNVRADAPGFRLTRIENVLVQSANLTKLDFALDVGAVMETVEVSADSPSEGINATVSNLTKQTRLGNGARTQLSTPRLREFFPETLVWQPSIETDREGRAALRFKFADNITTWKISVIGSTADGELGLVEQEIRAFQPFFVEHDPPRILTEGDEINLPVVLRNYLDRQQTVDVEIKPENWFTLEGPAHKQASVASGEAARETFGFRAVASVTNGKQRITARGAEASDAIEKPVSVHPDGEELTATAAQIFNDSAALDVEISPDAIHGSLSGELKIYPNLSAHVVESVEGIMQRPHGCGEQTISSTYPSLLVLRLNRQPDAAQEDAQQTTTRDAASRRAGEMSAVGKRARHYLQLGYERLLGYRSSDGGFSYWGDGNSDFALTAYALKFLNDAREVYAVDESVVAGARDYLVRQQREDGTWPVYRGAPQPDATQTAFNTAYVARVLARTAANRASASSTNGKPNAATEPLARAMRYLARRVAETDEPYLAASYALAAADAGDMAESARAAARLRALAEDAGEGASFWPLKTSTPFHGWGQAGRIETTALAVQALARANDANTPAGETRANDGDALVSRGMLYLLRNKDRYGVWMSTQATVNVLDALILLSSARATNANAAAQSPATTAEIFVNGKRAASVQLPPVYQVWNPVVVNVSQFLNATGTNRVEIRRPTPAAAAPAQAQLVASYYIPWDKSPTANAARAVSGSTGSQTPALSLKVQFDRTEAEINQPINCRVEAARNARHSYGMMLGEIGLPPGAEIDRASLDRAMQESGGALSRYDVLPDRLVVYLWPSGRPFKFDFKFRPRFGLAAQSAASHLYDYYNPEAHTLLAPTKFVIR